MWQKIANLVALGLHHWARPAQKSPLKSRKTTAIEEKKTRKRKICVRMLARTATGASGKRSKR